MNEKTVLLDIDGVLVTTPGWKVSEQLADGFMKFDGRAVQNLLKLLHETKASIVLTTTHRINYSIEQWYDIFKARGLHFLNITKINDRNSHSVIPERGTEIQEWVEKYGRQLNYVVIDDDLSINGLPDSIKERCVLTQPLIGFDESSLMEALRILNSI